MASTLALCAASAPCATNRLMTWSLRRYTIAATALPEDVVDPPADKTEALRGQVGDGWCNPEPVAEPGVDPLLVAGCWLLVAGCWSLVCTSVKWLA
jgi:hypothetical protein